MKIDKIPTAGQAERQMYLAWSEPPQHQTVVSSTGLQVLVFISTLQTVPCCWMAIVWLCDGDHLGSYR